MDKKIYFKVYQSKHDTNGSFFVETIDKVLENLPDWLEDCEYSGEDLPVLEPVEMTGDEFNNLPEFEGF